MSARVLFEASEDQYFDITHSLFGRWVASRLPDRIVAENATYFLTTVVAVALILGNQFVWALVEPGAPDGSSEFVSILFWAGQALFVIAFAAIFLIGFRPGFRVTCLEDAVRVEGRESLVIRYDQIKDVRIVSELVYHRRYRRMERTLAFIGKGRGSVVLVELDDHILVAVSLRPEHQQSFARILLSAVAASHSVLDLKPAQVA